MSVFVIFVALIALDIINVGQKSKFWSKIEILVKNQNFGQK